MLLGRSALLAAQVTLLSCSTQSSSAPPAGDQESRMVRARNHMVEVQLRARGIRDESVLRAMATVPREFFVPAALQESAYDDNPLPIGHDQTISQPYIVAFMTEALEPTSTQKILEIGTGSGYQAAVLASIVRDVYSIEIVPELGARAASVLSSLKFQNVHLRVGDGYAGWPDAAPFDGILVTAAPDHVPQPLVDQLAVGGRMVIPVGVGIQELLIVTRTPDGVVQRKTMDVRFVPFRREQPARD